MSKVFTIGEILVEIMASKIGQPFDQPGIWNGPYPRRKVARLIKALKEEGKIVRVGSDRKGYWEIKDL